MMRLGGGLDPELVAQIQALTGGMGNVAPAGFGDTAGARSVEPAWQPEPEDEGMPVMQAIGGILTSPFRLVGAAKRGLEDALGHPNAVARDQREAQYDMTLKYLLASNSIPEDVKRLLQPMMPPVDRSGLVGRQTSTDATATGRSYDNLPTPEPRRMGVLEWLTGEDRRQRARDEATVAAALKLAGLDWDMQKDAQEVRRIRTAGDHNEAQAAGQWWKNEQGYKYDDRDRLLGQAESIARRGASNASAYSSTMSGNATRDRNARDNEYYEQVRLPGGLANLDQRGQYHDLRMRTGEERLNQLRAQGPVDLQTKQARLARAGGAGDAGPAIPKDYVSAVKGVNVALNQAIDDARADSWLYLDDADRRAAAEGVYARFGVPLTEGGEPNWEAYVEKFRAKPVAPQPDTASATTTVAPASTVATRPNGAERYKVFDLLKKANPGLDDGIISQRADLIAEAMPTLDFTDVNAFMDSAEMAGLNDDEMVLLWESRTK